MILSSKVSSFRNLASISEKNSLPSPIRLPVRLVMVNSIRAGWPSCGFRYANQGFVLRLFAASRLTSPNPSLGTAAIECQDHSLRVWSVTAPSDADVTALAYLANTPRV